MSKFRPIMMALALLGALAPALSAQGVMVFEPARRAWLGFSYERTELRRPGEITMTLNVVSVVAESPAAKAGLQKGDAVLRINGLGASEALLGSLGSSLSPGDTVTVRVRRDGAERDLRLIAAAPPRDMGRTITIRVNPDSVRQLVRVFTDSMRVNMDSTVFKYLQRGDSATGRMFVWRDSLMGQLDTVRLRGFMHVDSARMKIFRQGGMLDSLARGFQFKVEGDSTIFFGPDSSRVFTFNIPSNREHLIGPYSFMVGMRAVAGAELNELNPELARYFRVEDGLLVVNAAAGTPAHRAGLRSGDVITAVDGTAVTTIPQLRRAIERADAKTVKLNVVRDGRQQEVQLPR